MKIDQYHYKDDSKIWSISNSTHSFEFDLDGTLICVLPLNGIEATKEQIFEAIKFYDNY